MSELRITTEFESGHSTVAEHRASWSRLEIWIGDECVTQFQDLTQQELRYGILRPLYPIAEWLLTNWWSVFFESHHPQRYGYWRRHCLRTAEEGFALPDLEFRCFGELTELIWNRRRSAHQMAEFVSEGRILLPRNEVQTELFRFLECVCHRLEKRGVADNFVMQEWRILQNLKTDEQSFCRVAGALGLDPFDTDEDSAGKIEAATQQLPFELHEEIFSVADPQHVQELVDWVNHARCQSVASQYRVEHLLMAARPRSATERRQSPAKVGYARARELRQTLRLPVPDVGQNGVFPLDALAEGLDEFSHSTESTNRSEWIDSLGDATQPDRLKLWTGKRLLSSRRFAIARAIGDFLAIDNPGLFVIPSRNPANGDVSTARQQFNRAFAAELLAPAEVLADRVDSQGFVSEEQLAEWAVELQVSEMVVSWQLRNHNLATIGATF